MKKIISFSLWGDSPHMWEGAAENARLAKLYYPEWECWFHVPADTARLLDASYVRQAVDALYWLGNARLEYVNALHGWPGLFWRFAPVFDADVAITLIRDCDSRLNPREAAAVNEWLNFSGGLLLEGFKRGRTLHHMRDHIEHTTVPIMGGMCGFTHWPRMRELLGAWTDRDHKGADQEFLAASVWPLLREDALCHDRWPDGTHYPSSMSPEDPAAYHYKPEEFFGVHKRFPFPAHPDYDFKTHGAFVGARVQ